MKRTPIFLTLAEVVSLHQRVVEDTGGSPELRDIGLLQSALGMPEAAFGGEYLHPDLASMAAAYLYHLVMNHPFVDGNKRIGAVAARVFALVNDAEFSPPEDEFERIVLSVATGQSRKDDVVAFMRKHIKEQHP